jgi:alpha-L-fucosidase
MKHLLLILLGILAFPQVFSQWKIIEKNEINPILTNKNSHASSIIELKNGHLMTTWFEGTHEGNIDVAIYISIYSKGKWQKAEKVATGIDENGQKFPCWNPVLFQNSKGKIFILYKIGPNPREWWGMKISSADNGKTWSKPEKLPDGFLGAVKNKPLLLKNNTVLHGSSTESKDEKIWNVHFEISDENLDHWKKIEIDNGNFGIIQPSLIQHPDGRIQALMRSRQNKIISVFSNDQGKSWSLPLPLDIPNPNSAMDAIRLSDGTFLMVYNPLEAGKNWWEGRNILKLAASKDGLNWTDILTLENHEKGEFSYPAIILSKSGKIHISYTNNRKNILHLVLQKL